MTIGVTELAARAGCTPRAIRKAAARGEIRSAFKRDGDREWRFDDGESWLPGMKATRIAESTPADDEETERERHDAEDAEELERYMARVKAPAHVREEARAWMEAHRHELPQLGCGEVPMGLPRFVW